MRDSNGVLRAASARCLDSVGSALQAEAEALRDGVRLIPEGTTEHVILETDRLSGIGLTMEEQEQISIESYCNPW